MFYVKILEDIFSFSRCKAMPTFHSEGIEFERLRMYERVTKNIFQFSLMSCYRYLLALRKIKR